MNLSSRSIKIMIVGAFVWPWYQEAFAKALEFHGCDVIRFSWVDDFYFWDSGKVEPSFKSYNHKIQNNLLLGPKITSINKRLVDTARIEKPDIILFYNVERIYPKTVKKMREILPGTIFCQYSNDNPFSSKHKFYLWRHYLASMQYFDLHFVYRENNKDDYRRHGISDSHLLRSYFIPEYDYPLERESVPYEFRSDVVFAGHYEDDGRVEMLEEICNLGFKVRLYGGGWDAAKRKLSPNSPLMSMFPIAPVTGINYQYAICGSKVALCFLSTLNKDTYTRRNFQIPAMRVAMLSQKTNDLVKLFKENQEAMFFVDKKDMLEKLKLLLFDDNFRDDIRNAGYQKVYAVGHDVNSRMQDWLNIVLNYKKEYVKDENEY